MVHATDSFGKTVTVYCYCIPFPTPFGLYLCWQELQAKMIGGQGDWNDLCILFPYIPAISISSTE